MPTGPGSLLIDVADRASDVDSVMSAVTDALRSWVGVGPVFLATADPLTGTFTGTFTFDIPPDAATAFFEIEMSGQDPCTFEGLARSETGMAALFSSTGGHPEVSQRWREVISPLNWGDEARAAVRSHGQIWGYLCLHREANDRAFKEQDRARLAKLLPAVATALRTAAVSFPTDRQPLETGVILSDASGHLLDTTGAAGAWLAELGPAKRDRLPLILEGLCRQVSRGETVSTTVTTRTGRVALVEAARLQSTPETQVAIVIRAAPPTHALPRFARAVGLTEREQEVVSLVLRGFSTRDIANELTISVHTVQAHLTGVFTKTGLNSRRALATRLRP